MAEGKQFNHMNTFLSITILLIFEFEFLSAKLLWIECGVAMLVRREKGAEQREQKKKHSRIEGVGRNITQSRTDKRQWNGVRGGFVAGNGYNNKDGVLFLEAAIQIRKNIPSLGHPRIAEICSRDYKSVDYTNIAPLCWPIFGIQRGSHAPILSDTISAGYSYVIPSYPMAKEVSDVLVGGLCGQTFFVTPRHIHLHSFDLLLPNHATCCSLELLVALSHILAINPVPHASGAPPSFISYLKAVSKLHPPPISGPTDKSAICTPLTLVDGDVGSETSDAIQFLALEKAQVINRASGAIRNTVTSSSHLGRNTKSPLSPSVRSLEKCLLTISRMETKRS
ncbi:uncharacterized protein BDR25DRAFT_350667 [Lindgomyces ingoldianus]|uniref:Uncharacterized protein n=1 Tax=Lindgomyces ingoldianus TaxID=673940 RepID=A0ACB6RAB9_9PLEO|nr:uncharacterized protein BDR25DRAFT_350667 [Lindgomyces ingoldianus]KAF2475280.1 hypothetical protein BDR25DRAFT_350667 [Lindgomyces ingoldianus]